MNSTFQKLILIIGLFLINSYAYSQNYFLKRYSPGVIGQYFYGKGIYELPNKGFAMIAGDSYSGGWLLLTDSTGNILINKHLYGFASYMYSDFDDFIVLNDGNYLIVGSFFYASSNTYRGLLKIDPQGNVIWGKHLGNGGWVSEDFFVRHSNGKQSLVADNSSNYGILISSIDSSGNIVSTIRIQDSLNRTINVREVKPIKNNGFFIGGTLNLNNPILMAFDSSCNKIFSVSFPDFYKCEDIIQTKDKGYLCLFRDSTVYYSFHIVKTDSLGQPIWTKTFTDSLKTIGPKLLYENDDKTFYCLANWNYINSPYYNYSGVIFLMDSLGDIISVKDSMIIQNFVDIQRTSSGKLCTLLARGSSNSNRPAIWMTDTTFAPTTSCIQFSNTTSISQLNSSATVFNVALKFFNYPYYSPQVFNVFESSLLNNSTFTCLPSGVNCYTKFNTITVISCNSYLHPGETIPLTLSGTYSYTYYDSLGCDSVVIVNLSILNNSTSQINVTECESYLSPSGNYIWTTSGTYLDTIPNMQGCDSIITVNLTINGTSDSFINVFECESYTSPSTNYIWNTSGIYHDTIPNSSGCDSIITIDLTVLNSTGSYINAEGCNSYVSPSGNYTWTTSGTYYDTIVNSIGCDSIITINLTINYNTTSNLSVVECNSYTSPSGNYTWTTSGIYYDMISNSSGCDSIITINLTINSVNTSVTANSPTLSANANNALYQWIYCDSTIIPGQTNQSFTAIANGSYAVIITENSCTDTSLCYSVLNVSVNETNYANELIVYPNPTENTITIKYPLLSNLNSDIKIFDFTGREVYSLTEIIKEKNLNKTIDVSEFADGIYFIQIKNSEKLLGTKFVKQ